MDQGELRLTQGVGGAGYRGDFSSFFSFLLTHTCFTSLCLGDTPACLHLCCTFKALDLLFNIKPRLSLPAWNANSLYV